MKIDPTTLEVVEFTGREIPDELMFLTCGDKGLMTTWIINYRDFLTTTVIKRDGNYVAQCLLLKLEDNDYKVSVFVSNLHRNLGLGTLVLQKALQSLNQRSMGARIRFGCRTYCDKFEDVYERVILEHKMTPIDIYSGKDYVKTTKVA